MSTPKPQNESGEDRFIARYFRPLARHPGAFGLRDDAAVLAPPPGHDLVLKIDPIVCGVHFFPDDPADAVGRKALRVNLSDLAAKGAVPAGFLLALALPQDVDTGWVEAFVAGLGSDAEHYGCPLLGGDTDRTAGPVTVAISAFGTLPHGTIVRRAGASVGDHVCVTGTIGDATLGLALRRDPDAARRWRLAAGHAAHLRDRYLLPQPRTALAQAVRAHASAAMDVSDGLAGDLAKLCRVSGVSAEIEAARVPLSVAAATVIAAEPERLELALSGGDDYEILCTIRPTALDAFRSAAASVGVPVTEIGRVTEPGDGALIFDTAGHPMHFAQTSYSHF